MANNSNINEVQRQLKIEKKNLYNIYYHQTANVPSRLRHKRAKKADFKKWGQFTKEDIEMAPQYVKNQSSLIGEMKINTHRMNRLSDWQKLNGVMVGSVGWGCGEAGALSHCCGGMGMGVTPQERNLAKSNKTSCARTFGPAVPRLGIYPEGVHLMAQK